MRLCIVKGCKAPRRNDSPFTSRCREHWNAYRRELRRRTKQEPTRFCPCGRRLRLNQPTLCAGCRIWKEWNRIHVQEREERLALRAARNAETRAREYANPTKEKTWLRLGKFRLTEVRRNLWRSSRGLPLLPPAESTPDGISLVR